MDRCIDPTPTRQVGRLPLPTPPKRRCRACGVPLEPEEAGECSYCEWIHDRQAAEAEMMFRGME